MGLRSTFVTTAALALALAACGSQNEADTAAPAGEAPADVAAADAMATGAPAAATPTAAAEFVPAAASGGMYEIESSKLAQQQSKNAEVKAFAAKMVADHTKASDALKAAAAKATPPVTVPAALKPDHQALLDQLKSAGANFDKTYLDQQKTAHEQTLGMLDGYASGGDSQPLKDWASKTKPTVQAHWDMVKKLIDKM